MTILEIRAFFGWCTLINFVMLWFMFIMMILLRGWAFKMHSKFFPITESQFTMAFYCFMGAYKLMFFMFNIIPWIALCIISD